MRSTHENPFEGGNMNAIGKSWTLRQLSLSSILLICFNTAVAQTSYKVTDLGALHDGVFGCAMGLNNKGWTESMDGYLDGAGNFVGRAVINVDGLKIDLGTLGGRDSWIWWGGINEQGEAVGLAETAAPDPDGEDFCGFGTNLTCRPFIWQNGVKRALPTLGGNNGLATAINDRGQIAGKAQTTVTDSGCPPYQIAPPVLWEKGRVQQLPTVARDPDGWAEGINDRGQIVGGTGTCSQNNHAVLWENGSVVELPNLGNTSLGNEAFAINNRGEIAGTVSSSDGTTFYAALWHNGILKNLGTFPGDLAAIATGINDKGQVVGSTLDSNFNWSRAFIWQNGAMIDLNTLFPADSNLYATMANKINSRGQISGMATVLSGPDAGNIHAFLATPVNASIADSIASIAVTHPRPTLPTNVGKQLLQRLGLGRFAQ
jgi:probable HAF family extracellular repeat protein